MTLLVFAASMAASAQEPPPAKEPASESLQPSAANSSQAQQLEPVEVRTLKDPEIVPYRYMLAGLDAFDENRFRAPNAAFRLMLRPRKQDASLENATLFLSGENTSIPIPLSADGGFVLARNQAAADDGADLVLNRQKGLLPDNFAFKADIHSPGVPANRRRLGDLRLECEVEYAIMKAKMPLFARLLIKPYGSICEPTSRKMYPMISTPSGTAKIMLNHGERREPSTGLLPMRDLMWPDDTLVEFVMKSANAPERAKD